MNKEQLQEIYLQEDYYWGKEPNVLAKKVLDLVPIAQRKGKRLVDLGAGEGRDSAFLAKEGFDVLAVDIAPAGLAKAQRLADEMNTTISTKEADINNLQLLGQFDVIYSIGTFQYIQPSNRSRQIQHIKDQTAVDGLHAIITFVENKSIEIAPDWGKNEYLFEENELLKYYHDWNVLYYKEEIFDCNSSGIPHKHAVGVLLAKRSCI